MRAYAVQYRPQVHVYPSDFVSTTISFKDSVPHKTNSRLPTFCIHAFQGIVGLFHCEVRNTYGLYCTVCQALRRFTHNIQYMYAFFVI